MDTELISYKETDGILSFTLKNLNVSLANAIRRNILSEIPIVAMRTSPYEKNDANFEINKTNLNNEILKQRLSCIPIHINNVEDFPAEQYVVEVHEKNESNLIQYVTTENFKIKNISNNSYLSDDEVKKIFPPSSQTGYYIDFVRLMPKISDNILGQELKFNCKLSKTSAKEDNMFNVACTSVYAMTQDVIKTTEKWTSMETELKSKHATSEEIELAKNNYMAIDAKRNVIPDSFDFKIETIGIYSNKELVKTSCDIMVKKAQDFVKLINEDELPINPSDNTNNNSYDIIMYTEDYTFGKVLEYFIHDNYYEKEDIVQFCGFNKEHPHDSYCIVRIIFKEEQEIKFIQALLINICNTIEKTYNKINSLF